MIVRKGGNPNFLSDNEIYDIHVSTLDLLEHVGVLVESEEALGLLHGIGANVVDNDIAGIVSRILNGITVSDETLATEVTHLCAS